VEGERPDFLPPQPAGPAPELGQPPQQQSSGYAPPEQAQAAQRQDWAYAPQPVQPDNGPAVTGFVLSLVGGGLLIVTGGISSIVSVICSVFGIVQSRKGKKKVESGETTRNAGLAQAGFIIGIVSLTLSVLATLVWSLIVVLLATDDQFREDFENEFDDSNTVTALVRVAALGARAFLA
jgi:hypothetical protein